MDKNDEIVKTKFLDTLRIELKNGFEACREIYFKNGQENFFSWGGSRKPMMMVVFFLSCSLLFYFLSVRYSEVVWIFLLVVFAFPTLISIYYLGKTVTLFLKWKYRVNVQLRSIRRHNEEVLTLTPNSIELVNSDETSIDRWENFKHVSILQDHVSMIGKDGTTICFRRKQWSLMNLSY